MRVWQRKEVLEKVAEQYATHVVIRKEVNGNYENTLREATKEEKDILTKIILGTLQTVNNNLSTQAIMSMSFDMVIKDCAEFILQQFIPECNAYETLHKILGCIINSWEER